MHAAVLRSLLLVVVLAACRGSAATPETEDCTGEEEEVSLLQVGFDRTSSRQWAALAEDRYEDARKAKGASRGDLETQLWATFSEAQGPLWSVAISPCGTRMATASADHKVRIYDLDLPDMDSHIFPLTLLDSQDEASSVAFWEDENKTQLFLGTGDFTGTWRLYSLGKEQLTASLLSTTKMTEKAIEGIAFSPDTPVMVAIGSGGPVQLFSLQSPTEPFMVEEVIPAGGQYSPVAAALTPLGHRLALGQHDGSLNVWSTNKSGLALRDTLGLQEHINNLAFSSDNELLAVASWDKTARLYGDLMEPGGSMTLLATIEGASEKLNAVSFNHDNTLLATGSWDGKARIYDITVRTAPQLLATLDEAQEPLRSVAFGYAHGHDVLATACKEGKLRVYRVDRQ